MAGEYTYFIKTQMKEHIGKWVAISDERIIASGKSVKDVIAEAKRREPKKRPFVTKVPEQVAMIF